MNRIWILVLFLGLIFSCVPPTHVGCAPTVGDLIEYSVTIDTGSTAPPVVAYYNATEQQEYYYFPNTSVLTWSFSFNTTKVNQFLYVSFSTSPYSGINKTAVIKVNGTIVEQGTSSSGVVIDCN